MKSEGREELARFVEQVGGVDSLYEMLHDKFSQETPGESGEGANVVPDENTDGFCYLRFFDAIDQVSARAMGPYPTVAEIRRFTNSRADPFGARSVTVALRNGVVGRHAHVSFNASPRGLRPLQALSGLAKDVRVGALPDGVSENFPPDWIPAKKDVYQTWDYTTWNGGNKKRNLHVLDWLGPDPLPDSRSKAFELISSPFSKVKWVLKASPVGPVTGKIDLIDASGTVRTVRSWESMVAPWGHYQDWSVRGDQVFAEAHVWRPAKMTTTPGAPAPTPPTRGDGKDELFSGAFRTTWISHGRVASGDGRCYVDAFKEPYKVRASVLGEYPTCADLLAFLMVEHAKDEVRGEDLINDGLALELVAPGLYHVSEGGLSAENFLEKLFSLPLHDRIGATQSEAVTLNRFENTALPAALAIEPTGVGQIISVPFASKLTMDKPQLFWGLTNGKKLNGLMAYFESVELIALKIKATVHKGDADTLLSIVADAARRPFSDEMDWVASSHTLHLSGNINGATTGELVLEGNHGFGTQLKGVAVGNATPNIQAYLDTSVVANALIKAVLVIRVSGTGNAASLILAPMEATKDRGFIDRDNESDEEPCDSFGKRAGRK